MDYFGRVVYRKGKLYFNKEQWVLLKQIAQRVHQSPKTIVIRAIKKGIKLVKIKN